MGAGVDVGGVGVAGVVGVTTVGVTTGAGTDWAGSGCNIGLEVSQPDSTNKEHTTIHVPKNIFIENVLGR